MAREVELICRYVASPSACSYTTRNSTRRPSHRPEVPVHVCSLARDPRASEERQTRRVGDGVAVNGIGLTGVEREAPDVLRPASLGDEGDSRSSEGHDLLLDAEATRPCGRRPTLVVTVHSRQDTHRAKKTLRQRTFVASSLTGCRRSPPPCPTTSGSSTTPLAPTDISADARYGARDMVALPRRPPQPQQAPHAAQIRRDCVDGRAGQRRVQDAAERRLDRCAPWSAHRVRVTAHLHGQPALATPCPRPKSRREQPRVVVAMPCDDDLRRPRAPPRRQRVEGLERVPQADALPAVGTVP